MADAAAPIEVTVVSDVICPWCWLGAARLRRGAEEAGIPVTLSWRPFELNPDMPSEGMERAAYRAAKLGAERSDALDAEMTRLGAEEGLDYRFGAQTRTPNTRRAHALIAFASTQQLDDAVSDRLFRAYFNEGADLTDEAVLLACAVEAGLDGEHARRALADDQLAELVAREEERARAIGVTGVPFFIVAGRWAISGAQPAELWREALVELSGKIAAGDGAPEGQS
ncbi:DsbA family oxidoreductase [Salinarimonas ramus]|uniref:DSBA oxidoreductase n=1 Tax=Salinarimonas ramus TaxID=690164 RepID=A0A917V4Q6_9HYPH|nr:DsbA family oxidoreductase [Salinarimonas ramus]GGK36426.1 DSBA oxidoreductase [Salinarimonas ramus]